MGQADIEPFEIAIPDAEIDDLRTRVQNARYPDQIHDTAWSLGTDIGYLRSLARYWAEEYDWRKAEAALNAHPNFLTEIDGQRIHFVHRRSSNDDALPLLITHGWPGSITEFTRVIEPLAEPDDPADAFHVITPSIPGYGFSGPTGERGWDLVRVARAWATLMSSLGYERYGAQGGDWGSFVTRHLAHVDKDHVCGVHVNMIAAMATGADGETDDLTEREQAQLERSADYMATGSGYVAIQSTRPQTLAYALNDSPIGLLSWIVEKFWAWTDNDGSPEDAVSRDEILTNASVYWFTGTIGSSMRFYLENIASGSVLVDPITDVPLGVANYPKEILAGPRSWVERDHNVTHWSDMDRGGHFASLEVPDGFVGDVRAFFRGIR